MGSEMCIRDRVPIDTPVWFQAQESHREGRKLTVTLTVSPDRDGVPDVTADPLITAEGLFIMPNRG